MKSRTSFSKLTTFKKDIFRYAPIWALYLVFTLLMLFSQGGYSYDRFARNVMGDLIIGFGIVNLCYAGLVAMMLYGDLYNTRMCYSLHSLPQRRESWLLSHLASGMLFSMVPNLLAAVFLMARLQDYWFIALYWYLAVTLQYLFFFGLASVSALLSGNRFAMLAIYAGFNFVAMLCYATVQFLYLPTITGVYANMEGYTRFSPSVHFSYFDYFAFVEKDILIEKPGYAGQLYDTFYEFTGLADGWGYLAIVGGVGLALMGLSFWLYRIRHLESAGDFLAFPRLKGISCVIITVCVTLCCALLGEVFNGGLIIWMIVGLIVGYFGSLMLLERRLKVFRKKTLLGFVIFAVVAALSFCAVGFDWFGIESWTPSADRVESVTVSNFRNSNGWDGDYYYGDRLQSVVTDQADIEQIILAHEDILSRLDFRKDDINAKTHRVTLTYKMKSGRTVIRSYSAPANGVNYEIIMKYLYTMESVLGFSDYRDVAGKVGYMYCYNLEIAPENYEQVLRALQLDFMAGHIDPVKGGGEYYMEFMVKNGDGTQTYRTVTFSDKAENLITLMKTPKFQMGYTDWDAFLESVWVTCEGAELTREEAVQLLEAIRKDVELGYLVADDYEANTWYIVQYEWRADGVKGYRNFNIHKGAVNTMEWIEAYLGKDEPNPEGK